MSPRPEHRGAVGHHGDRVGDPGVVARPAPGRPRSPRRPGPPRACRPATGRRGPSSGTVEAISILPPACRSKTGDAGAGSLGWAAVVEGDIGAFVVVGSGGSGGRLGGGLRRPEPARAPVGCRRAGRRRRGRGSPDRSVRTRRRSGQTRASTPASTSSSGTAPTVHESTPSAGLSRSTHQPSGSRRTTRLTATHPVGQPYDGQPPDPRDRAVDEQQPVAVVQRGLHRAAPDDRQSHRARVPTCRPRTGTVRSRRDAVAGPLLAADGSE